MNVNTIIARAQCEDALQSVYVSHGHVLRVFEECARGLVELPRGPSAGFWWRLSAFRFRLYSPPAGEIFVEIVDDPVDE